ncbi:MAG: hypothetical protein SFV54_07960 [Bryobacteraceae bacterium]|nr:hypothetical protein [Bryobacteraceae bacterium]
MRKLLPLCTLILLSTALSTAADGNRNFPVQFTGCTEYVGFGPISLTAAQQSLPAGYTAANLGGVGGLVIRVATCAGASTDGSPAKPGIVAHYGINILSPDGTGDINNYTLSYATDSEILAGRLRKSGLPAVYNPELTVEDPAVRPGNLYAAIGGPGLTPYFVTGTVNDPVGSPFPFLANWWYAGKHAALKMATTIPAIAFGPAALVLNTATASPLGALITGNIYSSFPFYNVRGRFAAATMQITTTR